MEKKFCNHCASEHDPEQPCSKDCDDCGVYVLYTGLWQYRTGVGKCRRVCENCYRKSESTNWRKPNTKG